MKGYTEYFNAISQQSNNLTMVAYAQNDTANYGSSREVNETSTIKHERDENLAKVEVCVLVTLFIFTILGNTIVVMGILLRKKKVTRMYYFILHLAFADLTTAFFNVLPQLLWEITYRFQGGNLLCKFVKYVQILGPYSSSTVLVMTALDRYQAICYPLKNYTWTPNRSKRVLALAWIISLLLCLPQTFIFSYQQVKPATMAEPEAEYECWATFAENWGAKAYVTWYSTTVFVVPLIILMFCYFCITRAIWDNYNMKFASQKCEEYRRQEKLDCNDEEYVLMEKLSLSLRANRSRHVKLSVPRRSSTCFSAGSLDKAIIKLHTAKDKHDMVNKCSSCFTSRDCRHGDLIVPLQNNDDDGNQHQLKQSQYRENNLYHTLPTTGITSLSRTLLDEQNLGENRNVEMDRLLNKLSATCKNESYGQLYNICNLSPTNSEKSNISDLNLDANEYNCKCTTHTKQMCTTHLAGKECAKKRKQNFCLQGALFLQRERKVRLFLKDSRDDSRTRNIKAGRPNTRKRYSLPPFVNQQLPRTHFVKWISRAKIKSIKLTVTIISCYIFCSSPFIAAQLWSVYDPMATSSRFFTGATFTILTLLASLNSCVNPYVFLCFNPDILGNCYRGIFQSKSPKQQLWP